MEHFIQKKLEWIDDNSGATEAARAAWHKHDERMAERKKLPPPFPGQELYRMRCQLRDRAKTMTLEDLESLAQEIAEAEAQTERHMAQNEEITRQVNKLKDRAFAAMDKALMGIRENCRREIAALLKEKEEVYSRVPGVIPAQVLQLWSLAEQAEERLSAQSYGHGPIRQVPSVFEGLPEGLRAAAEAHLNRRATA